MLKIRKDGSDKTPITELAPDEYFERQDQCLSPVCSLIAHRPCVVSKIGKDTFNVL